MAVYDAPHPVITYEKTEYGNLKAAQLKYGGLHWNGMIFATAKDAERFLDKNFPNRRIYLVPFTVTH